MALLNSGYLLEAGKKVSIQQLLSNKYNTKRLLHGFKKFTLGSDKHPLYLLYQNHIT